MLVCKSCGSGGELLRCSGCKEVRHCTAEHQRRHWNAHKRICRFVQQQQQPESVWIELPPGGTDGKFSDRFIDHIFANKEEGFQYVASLPDFSDGNMSRPMPSAWAGFLGWDVEIYCSGKDNILDDIGTYFQSRWMEARLTLGRPPNFEDKMNSPTLHLGRSLSISGGNLNGVNGTLFATGRNIRDGRPINSQQLAGIVIFLSNENRSGREDQAAAKQYYLDGTWQPPIPQIYGGMETRMYASDVRTGLNVFDHTAECSDDEQ
mmetsp:Transcript_26011/g.47008  ORF Transcript_26011/g.47008 Transcript_26011/m.47008 type:complete len:263 (+) Transcript_26011:241-1029(+)